MKRFFYIGSVLIISGTCVLGVKHSFEKKEYVSNHPNNVINKDDLYSNDTCIPRTYEEWLKDIAPKIYTAEQLNMVVELHKIMEEKGDFDPNGIFICDESSI